MGHSFESMAQPGVDETGGLSRGPANETDQTGYRSDLAKSSHRKILRDGRINHFEVLDILPKKPGRHYVA